MEIKQSLRSVAINNYTRQRMTHKSQPFVKPPRKRRITHRKILNRLYREGKAIYHSFGYAGNQPKTILFIVGCQRSGTTLMTQIFDRDLNAKMYPEVSELTSLDPHRQLRLNPLPTVKVTLDKDKAPLIILKPLVESQNILNLLDYFESSRALWLYRNYKDVAASHIKKWGNYNSINDLSAIIDALPNNWRYENVTDKIRDIVLHYYSEDMDPYDAAALYWFVRNSLYFELQLDTNLKIMICSYEELVLDPSKVMKSLYEFLGFNYPGIQIVSGVHHESVNKGRSVHLSSEIDLLCANLLEKLDQVTSNKIHNREG